IMGSSKGLLILSLLIGISGLGLSGYTLFFALPANIQQTESGIQNVWYVSNSNSVNVNSLDTILPDLSIIANINPSESLYVLFNSEIYFESQSGIEILFVYLSLNGHKVLTPVATFGAEFGLKVWGSLALQYSNHTIYPGVYNISVIAVVSDPTPQKSLYDMTLMAFTYV
ncbi:MAG: hypothetical protein ACFFDX_15015, partial [Candidatus Odinarchaeota archaeon]